MAPTDSSILRKEETEKKFPVIGPRYRSPVDPEVPLKSEIVTPKLKGPRQNDDDDFMTSYNALMNGLFQS